MDERERIKKIADNDLILKALKYYMKHIQNSKTVVNPKSKFRNGYGNYKWRCVDEMMDMKVGDSMIIKDRALDTVRNTWLWRAERMSGWKFKFKVEPIDSKTQMVWRVK